MMMMKCFLHIAIHIHIAIVAHIWHLSAVLQIEIGYERHHCVKLLPAMSKFVKTHLLVVRWQSLQISIPDLKILQGGRR